MNVGRLAYRRAINRAPVSIVLTRIPVTVDEWGNYITGDPIELPAQRVRIEYVKPDFAALKETGGLIATGLVRIVGAHDADIKKDDTFTYEDIPYVVTSAVNDRDSGMVALAAGATDGTE